MASATNFSLSGWFYFDSVANNKTLYSYGGTGTNYGITVQTHASGNLIFVIASATNDSGSNYIETNLSSVLYSYGGTGTNYGITVQTHASGNLIFVIASATNDSGSNYIQTNLASVLTTSTWYHIVCTYDGSQAGNTDKAKIYINGTEVAYAAGGGTIPATTSASTGPFNIGQWDLGGSNRFFDGEIGRVSVYGSTLTPTQITALYKNPMAISGNAPIAYYPLGGGSTGDAADPATTLTIPNSSVPSATVFEFNVPSGGIDRITLGQAITLTGNKTFSAWINLTMAQDASGFMFFGEATTNYYLFIQGDYIYIRDASGLSSVQYTPGFSLNTWYHICISGDGTNLIPYVNGEPISGTYIDREMQSENTIGSYSNGTFPYRGEMSNVQIWDTNLSGPEVTTLYNNGVPLFSGTQPQAANLKGWWKMNVDTSTWNGSDWVIGNSTANYSTALDFDGNDNISLSTINLGTTNTVSFWINRDSYLTQEAPLGDPTAAAGAMVYINGASGNVLYKWDGGWTTWTGLLGTIQQQWIHVLIIRNGTSSTAYLNGGSGTTVTTGGTADNSLGIIGSTTTNANYLNSKLSNVAVWNSDQTSEKDNIYNGGTPAASYTNTPTAWWKLDNTTIADSSGNGNTGTNNGATQVSSLVSTLNGSSSGMTTANLVNSDLTRSIPYSSYSMVFDGVSDYITLSNPTIFTDFSLSFWYKSDSAVSGYDTVVGRDTIDGGILTSIVFTGPLSFKNRPGSWTALTTTSPSSTEFKHFSVTYDSTANELKGYCNGVLEVTTTPVFSSATGNEQSFDRIGRYYGSNYLDGQLSNLATFSSILSQDQILTIYNGGVPNDISSLSPVNWWSLSGDSYFDGSNFICPDLGSGNNNGTSSGMGGTELVGDGPGSTANGIATSMNIPGSLQGNAPNSSKNAFSVNMNSADRVEDVPA
jgi:hypothetical protein